jgi:hypothetical protein
MKQPNPELAFSRRNMLKTASCGFGYLAFASLAAEVAAAYENPMAPKAPHFAPRAKRVIFLFLRGGPSQMDTFDYKPQLQKDHGKAVDGNNELYGSPFQWKRRGESGLWVSSLFPHVAECADDLCILRSMQTGSSAHPQAIPLMHTGSFQFTRPSIGSWVLYGLGTENRDLPGFLTINPTRVFGGPANYGSAFLPAMYQGTRIGWEGQSLKNATMANLGNDRLDADRQRRQLELVQSMNQRLAERHPQESQLDGVISSYELGSRMQESVPQVMDLEREPESIRELYGIGQSKTDNFGRQCLMARRFAEEGVRFIELGHGGWDHHRNLEKGIQARCREIDQPIAGLLKDLKQRGMLEDTLVLWGGEFGRKPEIQNGDGRGHNPNGFTMWMAGGGVKPGIAYGKTDEHGNKAVENPVGLHDLHATILALLGLHHKKLTYRHAGREFRLTDVHGHIVRDIMA